MPRTWEATTCTRWPPSQPGSCCSYVPRCNDQSSRRVTRPRFSARARRKSASSSPIPARRKASGEPSKTLKMPHSPIVSDERERSCWSMPRSPAAAAPGEGRLRQSCRASSRPRPRRQSCRLRRGAVREPVEVIDRYLLFSRRSGLGLAAVAGDGPGEGVEDHAEPDLELVAEVVAGPQDVLGRHLGEVGVLAGELPY